MIISWQRKKLNEMILIFFLLLLLYSVHWHTITAYGKEEIRRIKILPIWLTSGYKIYMHIEIYACIMYIYNYQRILNMSTAGYLVVKFTFYNKDANGCACYIVNRVNQLNWVNGRLNMFAYVAIFIDIVMKNMLAR